MAKRKTPKDVKRLKKRIVNLLGELEERLIAAGYSFDGVRTSSVPTVFETLLEALRLDGYDIDPLEFGESNGADGPRRAERASIQPREPRQTRPKGRRSRGSIDEREWKRWLKRSPGGSRGQRIFIPMRGPHAHAGIPGGGKRR